MSMIFVIIMIIIALIFWDEWGLTYTKIKDKCGDVIWSNFFYRQGCFRFQLQGSAKVT